MPINFNEAAHLQDADIRKGDRWIYSADFNIKHDGSRLKSTDRIDAEVGDLNYILKSGGIPIILAHKGRFRDNDTDDLDFIVPYLESQLNARVEYFPENTTDAAVKFVESMKPGTAAIMGNTRKHKGEEKNDIKLAELFARLGQHAAIGGFGKVHRANASNTGILNYLPGYITQSQLREMELLSKWAGNDKDTYSVAVLGGIKKEKITTGLVGFLETYDAIIPGGIVLNTLLKASGYPIGRSIIRDEGSSYEDIAIRALAGSNRHKIMFPEKLIVAQEDNGEYLDGHIVNIDRIPEGYRTVDSILTRSARDSLERVVEEKGRLVLAGTPSLYTAGFCKATDEILNQMNKNMENCIIFGGDAAGELNYKGPTSTGGGSALHFVAYGTTPVFEALKTNKLKFQQ